VSVWDEYLTRTTSAGPVFQQQDIYSTALMQQKLEMDQQLIAAKYKPIGTNPPKKETGMFTEMWKDVKGFILEYRGVLYFLAAALIVDELVFKGAFRERLRGMADKIIAKVEAKVSA
jgi:hypothetical protein